MFNSDFQSKFWDNLQTFMEETIDEHIPDDIIYILTKNGYDCSMSINDITDEEIDEIERQMTSNFPNMEICSKIFTSD